MLDEQTRAQIDAARDPRLEAMGHPTRPGLRDKYELRMGADSPGNGSPGVPKIWPSREGTAGLPGQSGGRPIQNTTFYDSIRGLEDDNST